MNYILKIVVKLLISYGCSVSFNVSFNLVIYNDVIFCHSTRLFEGVISGAI